MFMYCAAAATGWRPIEAPADVLPAGFWARAWVALSRNHIVIDPRGLVWTGLCATYTPRKRRRFHTHRPVSHLMVQQIHAVTARRTVLLLLAAAVEHAGAVDCTADVAFNNVFAITSAVSKRNEHLRAECAREGLKCTLVPDVPKDALDVSKLQALARTSSEHAWTALELNAWNG